VKKKTSTPALTTSDDGMDLLDDDESPLIKDEPPPQTGMDINTVFTLPVEFKGVDEEIIQVCFGPKEAVFEKPEESSQYLKPLYIRGHIDERLIFRMIVDDGTVVNLMSCDVFKKLVKEDERLVKTILMRNGMGGNPIEARGIVSMELTVGSKLLATPFFIVEV
jgi:hypothetical protein